MNIIDKGRKKARNLPPTKLVINETTSCNHSNVVLETIL
jgi:hypothetical protein